MVVVCGKICGKMCDTIFGKICGKIETLSDWNKHWCGKYWPLIMVVVCGSGEKITCMCQGGKQRMFMHAQSKWDATYLKRSIQSLYVQDVKSINFSHSPPQNVDLQMDSLSFFSSFSTYLTFGRYKTSQHCESALIKHLFKQFWVT